MPRITRMVVPLPVPPGPVAGSRAGGVAGHHGHGLIAGPRGGAGCVGASRPRQHEEDRPSAEHETTDEQQPRRQPGPDRPRAGGVRFRQFRRGQPGAPTCGTGDAPHGRHGLGPDHAASIRCCASRTIGHGAFGVCLTACDGLRDSGAEAAPNRPAALDDTAAAPARRRVRPAAPPPPPRPAPDMRVRRAPHLAAANDSMPPAPR